jgi:CTP:molybdopterin cytidylyltransferase MocA
MVGSAARVAEDYARLAVVVPVHNQPRMIVACIEALLRSGVDAASIVVVDDASTDGTGAAARATGANVVRCPHNLGPAGARNYGAQQSRSDLILFVDSDVLVDPSAVERVLSLMDRQPDVSAVFGSYDDEPAAPGLVSQYRNLLHHFVHQASASNATTFWTGCGAIRRSAFEAIGGFDERRSLNYIEDVELGQRLYRAGHRIVLDKQLWSKHLKRWDVRSMVKTDLLHRALPWSREILAGGRFQQDLNLTWSHRCSVACTGVGAGLLAVGILQPAALVAAGAAFAGVAWLNAGLFLFLARKRGTAFAAACLPLHLAHHACAGLGFAYALSELAVAQLAARARAGAQAIGLQRPDSNH